MILIILTLGLLIGSFLNVCIYRIPRGESISFPPSHCPNCNTSLKPADLMPVLSYILLRGRCITCKVRISPRYPSIELLNTLVYVAIYSVYGNNIMTVIFCLTASVLIVISMIDLDTQTIPDRMHVIIGSIAFINILIQRDISVLASAGMGFIVGGGFFLLLAIITKGGMGGGDIKLMAVLGLLFGLKGIILLIFLAFVIGAVVSVSMLVAKLKQRKEFIPFGPFIAISGLFVMLWGEYLQSWLFLY